MKFHIKRIRLMLACFICPELRSVVAATRTYVESDNQGTREEAKQKAMRLAGICDQTIGRYCFARSEYPAWTEYTHRR
jgi:hypothetical protein